MHKNRGADSDTPYKTKTQQVSIGDFDLTIECLLDTQQFFDPEGHAEKLGVSPSFWPLFGQIWPSSLILGQVILEEDIANKRVLEVGCGLAIPSLIASLLGADITASDYNPVAEVFLDKNTKNNKIEPVPFLQASWDAGAIDEEGYDVIIASDVLYEPEAAIVLTSFINSNAKSSCRVILTDPNRGSHRTFAKKMTEIGFTHTCEDLSEYTDGPIKDKGFIFKFVR